MSKQLGSGWYLPLITFREHSSKPFIPSDSRDLKIAIFPKKNVFLNRERSKEIVGLTSKILLLKRAPKASVQDARAERCCSSASSDPRQLHVCLHTAAAAREATPRTWRHRPRVAVQSHAAAAHQNQTGRRYPASECLETHLILLNLQTEKHEGTQVNSALTHLVHSSAREYRVYSVEEEISRLKQL